MSAAVVAKLVRQIDRIDGRFPMPEEQERLARRLTNSEEEFFRLAVNKHRLKVYRHGWPDFVLADPVTGAVYAVEVKSRRLERLRPAQRVSFSLLESIGLKVYVWSQDRPHSLTGWRDFDRGSKGFRSKPVKSVNSPTPGEGES